MNMEETYKLYFKYWMFVYDILVFLEQCAETLYLGFHGSCWPGRLGKILLLMILD